MSINMRMTPIQAQALARLIEPARSDWDFPGILAAIKAVDANWHDTAIAAITCAADPTAVTPAAIRNPIYWPATDKPKDPTPRFDPAYLAFRAERRRIEAEAATPKRIAQIRNELGKPRRTG